MSSGRPVISVHVDIAEFAGIVLAMPECDRAEWVTSLAIALSRRDPAKASNPDAGEYAASLLGEAQNYIETRSTKARQAAHSRHRRGQTQETQDSNHANACSRIDSHDFILHTAATEQSRTEQSRAEHNTPPSPNGDVSPRKRIPEVYPIPTMLIQIPEFKSWWLKWLDHRKQARHPVTTAEAQLQLEELTTMPDPVACLHYSISGGCQRLRKPDTKASQHAVRPVAVPNLPPDYIPLDEAALEAKKLVSEMPCVQQYGDPHAQPAC